MKSSDISIRRLKAGDAVLYRELRLRSLREHPEAFTSSYEEDQRKPVADAEARLSSDPDHRFWGAFSGSQLVAVVGLEREKRLKNRHKATVVGMYVASEYGHRGIGLALMQTLLEDAMNSGVELLVLTVTHSNQEAATLYGKLGFEKFGVEPGAIKVKHQLFDKEHMYLQLNHP